MELAGDIETVGKKVTLFKQGDKVFASKNLNFNFMEHTPSILLSRKWFDSSTTRKCDLRGSCSYF